MITPATHQDIMDVCILAKAYETDYSEHITVDIDYCIKQYIQFVESGIGCVFVLKENDKVIGGIAGIKTPDIHCSTLIAVETFWFIIDGYRGKGIALLDTFEKWAIDNHCQKVAMIHLADSHPESLEKLYIRRGYKLTEKHYVKEI